LRKTVPVRTAAYRRVPRKALIFQAFSAIVPATPWAAPDAENQ